MINNLEALHTAINSKEEFKRLVRNADDLILAARQFPGEASPLINWLLDDPQEFQRLIKRSVDLKVVSREFPGHKDSLICRNRCPYWQLP